MRQRLLFWLAALLTGVLGYWVRFQAPVTAGMRDALGGAAYVTFWIVIAAALKPAAPALRLAAIVFAITCVLEFLQLWHPFWLEAIRRTFIGRATLGTTFEWDDFPPYVLGAFIGYGLVRILRQQISPLR